MQNVLFLQSLETDQQSYGFAAASCSSCFSNSCKNES